MEYAIILAVKVKELGEFGLIDQLNKMIADAKINKRSPNLILGVGDDAAAWQSDNTIQLATVDTMIQGIHFTLDTATWQEVGWKSLAINLSDIAAMGGVPRYTLIALALPKDADVANVTELYRGMIVIAKEYGVAIVGGNISRGLQVSITITVLGSCSDNKILKRSNAKIGDAIAVTGYAGSAAAGLEMLKKKLKFKSTDAEYLRNTFLHPIPRVSEGQLLVKNGITATIDTSDGLLADLSHICEASKVSAKVNVDLVPIIDIVKNNFGERALELALGGGEDYELIFTGNIEAVNRVKKEAKCPVTIIGEITSGKACKIDLINNSGKPIKINKTGWTHF
jgi:thiamine-monophosphate kinase